jgi:hypothetical protein
MRLINTKTIQLHEFFETKIPPYTILSHRWEGAEVTFQDFKDGKATELKGYSKILGCCRQALSDGFEFTVNPLIPSSMRKSLIRYCKSGLIHAVSIKPAVLSCPKLSILCFDGTGNRKYAMHICPMSLQKMGPRRN